MRWFPYISRERHEEVVALHLAHEARLQAQIDNLNRRLDSNEDDRRKFNQSLVAALETRANAQPEGKRRTRTKAVDEEPTPIDPDDRAAVLRQAIRETGSRNAGVVVRAAERIQQRLRLAKQPNLDSGYAGVAVSDVSIDRSDVQRMIDEALAEGETLAQSAAVN